MEPLERSVVRNDLESSAKKVLLEVSCVIDYGLKFALGCRVTTLSFVERSGSVANDSFEPILFLGKDGADSKLSCVSILDEGLFHRGEW